MRKTTAFGRGVLAGALAMVGASAAHWLLTPMAHPTASTTVYFLTLAQMLGGFGAALWLVVRERRPDESAAPEQFDQADVTPPRRQGSPGS